MISKIFFAVIFINLLAFAQLDKAKEEREPLELRTRPPLRATSVGAIEKIIGNVGAERTSTSGKTKHVTIHLSGEAFERDRISTEDDARVHIRFFDKTFVEVGASTIFKVDRVRRGAAPQEDTILQLIDGVMRVTAISVEDWVHYHIKNFDRVVTVQGPSDLFLIHDPKLRELKVFVRKGNVKISRALGGESQQLREGQARLIKPDGAVRLLPPVGEEEWKKLKERTSIDSM